MQRLRHIDPTTKCGSPYVVSNETSSWWSSENVVLPNSKMLDFRMRARTPEQQELDIESNIKKISYTNPFCQEKAEGLVQTWHADLKRMKEVSMLHSSRSIFTANISIKGIILMVKKWYADRNSTEQMGTISFPAEMKSYIFVQ
ncbi:unnamed protein product [Citrullus colocynthis]|uniref:Uncharacterized protein n=1 Tax=Citrullus colocynthis TaxID=252529 RepID=A0ABP0YYL5_9ROSI